MSRWGLVSSVSLGCVLSLYGLCLSGQVVGPREVISFNAEWRFTRSDPEGTGDRLSYQRMRPWMIATGRDLVNDPNLASRTRPSGNIGQDVPYTQPDFDDSGWRVLDLPHDWGIEGPFRQDYPGQTGKLPWWGIGWYRKRFTLSQGDVGKRFYLDIDGAMSYANVWLNGQYVGGWPYGYASWRLDLTDYVRLDQANLIAIRLDNPADSSRWYPGGGIYRNVWLTKTSQIHIAQWGVFVRTSTLTKVDAKVDLDVVIENHTDLQADVNVKGLIYLLDQQGRRSERPVASSSPVRSRIGPNSSAKTSLSVKVQDYTPWTLQRPQLYLAIVTIEKDGKPFDEYQTNFGIRSIAFDPEKGFLLNGEYVRIQGVCNHHDLGSLGTAVNTRALQRQLELLKEMGCNAIRTSHNPPAPELLDLCDKMGFLVMDEAFDAWRRGKKRNDYHLLFDDWHEKDWRAMIRRDRNHPSVILWSSGNEIGEQGSPDGHKISAEFTRIAHEEDPTRPVTAGCNNVQAGYNGFQKTVDVFGYNYKPAEYRRFRQQNPDIPIFASETASCISSRGQYFFPVSDDKAEGMANFHVSSYDLYAPRWAWPPDVEFRGLDESPFVCGEFVWTGFDYLGEPTPYNADTSNLLNFTDPAERERMAKELRELGRIRVPSRSSYFGIIDLAGFKKDRFYIYQARWRPELPMAHILPHWNWPERVGQVTPVHVYTSGDEAELFLNGRSLGRKKKAQYQYRLRWDDVVYEPGELRVIAFKEGRQWAADLVKTTGPAATLMVEADRVDIAADGKDLSFVTVKVADANGLLVPNANNRITFAIEGPGMIVATDNGDPTCLESFRSPQRNAFAGLCLAIVRSVRDKPGSIMLKADSPGLRGAAISIRSQ